MSRLKELIGKRIVIRSDSLLTEKATMAVLVDIDDGGIWLEYQPFIETILAAAQQSVSPKTPVIFVPYAHIFWIIDVANYPALSEKSLGLDKS
jgi:hypothetical protein